MRIFDVVRSLVGCTKQSSPAHDFTTPAGAILCLEDAYRANDLEAAVACKDFLIEASVMLQSFKNLSAREGVVDELTSKTAGLLELSYRQQFEKEGFPNMTGVQCSFPKEEPFGENIVTVTEVCRYPDGGTSTQQVLVAKTEKGWRVLMPSE
jgi:hypothetical protein